MEEEKREEYNSAKYEDLTEAFNNLYKTMKEAVDILVKAAAKAYKELSTTTAAKVSTDPEIKKCYGIYKRTRKGRIAKKQLKRIKKIIKKKYYN